MSVYLDLWNRALEEEHGLAVASDDLKRLSAELYKARDLSSDPRLQTIRICFPAGGQEIFLVKNTVEVFQ